MNGLPYNLTLKIEDAARSGIDKIKDIIISTPTGAVPLDYVADIVSTTGPNTINRENVSRRLVVAANIENRDMKSAVDDIRSRLETIKLPQGYHIVYGGQFESEASASRTLMLASSGALIIIFYAALSGVQKYNQGADYSAEHAPRHDWRSVAFENYLRRTEYPRNNRIHITAWHFNAQRHVAYVALFSACVRGQAS